MIRHKRLVGALAVGAACGLAGIVGVLPAVGKSSPPSSPVVIGPTASIVARGVAARPFVYVVCQPGSYNELRLSLTERSGKGIASGNGRVEVPCSGQIQTIKIPVTAHGHPFVKGTGFAKVRFYSCSRFGGCGETDVSHTIKLKPKNN
jgi:hypothetical protein